jgi:hypothetical protein
VPTTEFSGVVQQINPTTLSAFNMTISDAQGTDFDGRQIQEDYGFQGTNTCYYPGGPTPQHPAVYNPQFNIDPWIVGVVNESNQHNHWGYDNIGNTPDVVDQIRQDRPDLLPCAIVIFQDMWIECDASAHFEYEQNNTLEIFVGMNYVENCRKAVLDSSNRCERLNYVSGGP